MYIHSVEIKNIRSIKTLKVTFDPEKPQGWHVIIGDNGSGKSSLVKSMAIGLLDHAGVMGLRENWAKWLRQKCRSASVEMIVHAINRPYKNVFGLKREGNAVWSTQEAACRTFPPRLMMKPRFPRYFFPHLTGPFENSALKAWSIGG